MAYLMSKDSYECDLCGFEMKWDASDDVHGEMWGCEKCGTTFCSKCFQNRKGLKAYMDMMQGFDLVLCPNCYDKAIFERRKLHGSVCF